MTPTVQTQNRDTSLQFDQFVSQLAEVEALIEEKLHSDVSRVTTVARHIIGGGGKRLRPLVALAASRLGGREVPGSIALAVCVEFLHTATLLHDDVVDESSMRRGRTSANALWGNATSVLVGDFLYARAFELMVSLRSFDAMEFFARTTCLMAEGEVLQLVHANDLDCAESIYFRIIQAKTAELFIAAARVGGIIADLSTESIQALETYGRSLGFAFQLVDDVLDYDSSLAILGKSPGDDFREGKVTLPIILALKHADKADRVFWERALNPATQAPDDFERSIFLLKKLNIFEDVLERARSYAAQARAALSPFPHSPEKDFLMGLTDYCITRSC